MELLRTIKKARWDLSVENTSIDTEILDLLPDPICNLRTIEMKLSVWDIGIDRVRLDQTIKALASTRDQINNIDYVIFSSDLLKEHDIIIRKTKSSQEKEIGDYHYDIEIPSSKNLLELTKSLILKADICRKYKRQIENIP